MPSVLPYLMCAKRLRHPAPSVKSTNKKIGCSRGAANSDNHAQSSKSTETIGTPEDPCPTAVFDFDAEGRTAKIKQRIEIKRRQRVLRQSNVPRLSQSWCRPRRQASLVNCFPIATRHRTEDAYRLDELRQTRRTRNKCGHAIRKIVR